MSFRWRFTCLSNQTKEDEQILYVYFLCRMLVFCWLTNLNDINFSSKCWYFNQCESLKYNWSALCVIISLVSSCLVIHFTYLHKINYFTNIFFMIHNSKHHWIQKIIQHFILYSLLYIFSHDVTYKVYHL